MGFLNLSCIYSRFLDGFRSKDEKCMMVIGHSKVQSGFEYVITGKHFLWFCGDRFLVVKSL